MPTDCQQMGFQPGHSRGCGAAPSSIHELVAKLLPIGLNIMPIGSTLPLIMKVRVSTLSRLGLAAMEPKARYRTARSSTNATPTEEVLAEFSDGQVPYASIEETAGKLGVESETVLRIMGIAPRTAARRKRERSLKADEADRLFRIARVLDDAIRVFASEDKAAHWLRSPHPLLWQQAPLDLLDSDAGAKAVTDELTRIDYGDFA